MLKQQELLKENCKFGNECAFPEDWTVENLLGKHNSRPYNPLIANTFFRAGYIEPWGRGIQKIRESCEENGNGTFTEYQWIGDGNSGQAKKQELKKCDVFICKS